MGAGQWGLQFPKNFSLGNTPPKPPRDEPPTPEPTPQEGFYDCMCDCLAGDLPWPAKQLACAVITAGLTVCATCPSCVGSVLTGDPDYALCAACASCVVVALPAFTAAG